MSSNRIKRMDKRFFISKENFLDVDFDSTYIQVGSTIELPPEEHLHFAKVLRGKIGDSIECFVDGGDVLTCEVDDISKNRTICHITKIEKCESNPNIKITLFQGLPKLDKLELICQKLCEIGVTEIVPFESNFTIAKDNPGKLARLDKIIVSACKQCGRTSLLKVCNTIKFDEMCRRLGEYDLVVFANEKETQNTLSGTILIHNGAKNIAYIIGSEGGFSDSEIEKLSSLATSVTLGKRILRTETASISVASVIAFFLEK